MISEALEGKIKEIIQEVAPEAFVIEIALHRSKRSILSIVVDTDEGIPMKKVASISRKVGRYLDESEVLDIAFNLEVGSPGVGQPLKLHRQYLKNIGRNLKVTTLEGKELTGKLIFADEELIRIQPEVPKKNKKNKNKHALASGEEMEVPFAEIKQAKVLVSFK